MKSGLAPILLVVLLGSCTTQLGDGGPAQIDAAPEDATPRPDSLPPGAREGELCLVSPEDATGGCAPGYACTVIGSGPAACRQTCPTLQFPCSGYSGPGYSFCSIAYNDDDGQPAGNLCLVVCGDENMSLRGCDDGACNGMCPGTWTCQNDPNNFGIKSCQ
jgi:hypothetical protein